MKNYVDKDKLQEFATKLNNKQKTIFATKSEVGSPLVASTVAAMTDTSKIYVYTGSESGYTAGNWYYYNGSAWTSGGVYNSTAFTTDTTLAIPGAAADAKAVGDALANVEIEVDATLTQAGKAADAKATGDAIGEVEGDVSNLKNAFDDICTGLGFDPADNLLDLDQNALLVNTTIQLSDGANPGATQTNTNYTATDFIPIDTDSLTLLTVAQAIAYRCAFYKADKSYLADLSFPAATAETNNYYGNHSFRTASVPANAAYIRFSASNAFFTYKNGLYEGNAQRGAKIYKDPSKKIDIDALDPRYHSALNSAVGGFVNNNGVSSYSLLASTNNWRLGIVSSLKGPQHLFFAARYTTLGVLRFGLNGESYMLAVDSEKYWFENEGVEPGDANKYPHNLTMKNYVAVIINIAADGAHMDGKIITNGGIKNIANNTFTSKRGRPTINVSSATRLSYPVASWEPEVSRPIWAFGDSYFSAYSSARWPYYLIDWGFDKNFLMNGYPGQTSQTGIEDFKNLLEIGCPRYAVWCLGMNNGDESDTINADWMSAVDTFLSLCNKYNIEPILSTIPNVPTVTHTSKNAWVKNSGYRYVDFAAIVGAETAGSTWFDGMLETSTPRVHPTADGAIALATEFLAKVPEITFK